MLQNLCYLKAVFDQNMFSTVGTVTQWNMASFLGGIIFFFVLFSVFFKILTVTEF